MPGNTLLFARYCLSAIKRSWRCYRRLALLLYVAFGRRYLPLSVNIDAQSLNTTMWAGIPCMRLSNNVCLITHPFPIVIVAFSSFATAAATSHSPLTSDIIFPAISLFMLLQFPLAMVCASTLRVHHWILNPCVNSSVKSHRTSLKHSSQSTDYLDIWRQTNCSQMLAKSCQRRIFKLVTRFGSLRHILDAPNDQLFLGFIYQRRWIFVEQRRRPANTRRYQFNSEERRAYRHTWSRWLWQGRLSVIR